MKCKFIRFDYFTIVEVTIFNICAFGCTDIAVNTVTKILSVNIIKGNIGHKVIFYWPFKQD